MHSWTGKQLQESLFVDRQTKSFQSGLLKNTFRESWRHYHEHDTGSNFLYRLLLAFSADSHQQRTQNQVQLWVNISTIQYILHIISDVRICTVLVNTLLWSLPPISTGPPGDPAMHLLLIPQTRPLLRSEEVATASQFEVIRFQDATWSAGGVVGCTSGVAGSEYHMLDG